MTRTPTQSEHVKAVKNFGTQMYVTQENGKWMGKLGDRGNWFDLELAADATYEQAQASIILAALHA